MATSRLINWLKTKSKSQNHVDKEKERASVNANSSVDADSGATEHEEDWVIHEEKPQLPVFSDRQKELIIRSWADLQAEIYHVGVVSFISLFEHKLEFRKSFAQFKNLSVDEIRISPLVKAHAMSILHVLEQLVGRINHTEKWEEIIDSLARRHVGHEAKPGLAKDVALQCWRSMEQILTKQGKYDQEVEDSWFLVIGWLGAYMEYSLTTVLHGSHQPSVNSRAQSLY